MNLLTGLLSRLKRPVFDAPMAPDGLIYAVGDLHGRADLLTAAIRAISAHATERGGDATIVFLGDYVDRGEQSAQVLRHVRAYVEARPHRVIALMGNHERMMLDFLADPVHRGRRWLRYGGLQALASYGVSGITERAGPTDLLRAAAALSEAMPEGEAEWMAALPARWQSGNVAFVHAGADPALPIADQDDDVTIWGHPEFAGTARTDGIWVVHGHTVVDMAHAANGRVALDTGAYFSGRLSVGVFAPDAELELLTVTA